MNLHRRLELAGNALLAILDPEKDLFILKLSTYPNIFGQVLNL